MSELFTVPDISQIDNSDYIRMLLHAGEKKRELCEKGRRLTPEEIAVLEKQGNHAENWAIILVCDDFTPSNIRNSRFFGTCYLGRFTGKHITVHSSISLPSGIYDSILIQSCVNNECCICNVRGMSNYFIDENAGINNVGILSCSSSAVFGNGQEIVIGIETGGLEVLSFAELTVGFAYGICKNREVQSEYSLFIRSYVDRCRTGFGIVNSECRINNCTNILDTLFGTAATCNNATLVQNASVLSSHEEPTSIMNGAFVRNSCIQWGCEVDSMAIVDESVLTEHSHVERHGKVTHSIIGPNTGIAEGEVTASLVGPFVGFHHQALLIGSIWPEGKGNVAYGANVGSNHTSKAPDQEIYCGEGMFFGLGSNIKFPSDFSRAPYSIIATGVTTMPQRMTFPFSLINTPSSFVDGISPAFNELIPGWVLSDNLYTIKRNEGKYKKRNKGRRSDFSFDVFRPEIVELMCNARNLLRETIIVKDYYFESDITGIGKNYVTRQNLVKAIETYSLHIEQYCLDGLYKQCSMLLRNDIPVNENTILTTPTDNPFWKHQRDLCGSEGFFNRQLRDNLERFANLVSRSSQQVLAAKEKDDIRGRKISDDYDKVHTSANDDSFVRETLAHSMSLKEEIYSVLSRIPEHRDNSADEIPPLT